MTDINRLIASLKRRSAHVKEFGDDITFIKLEDLDALVEAVELARNRAVDWEEKAVINYAERTAMIQHIAELESSAVTVKLPKEHSATEFLFPVAVYSAQELTAALTRQGIKWEAE
ncbi:TPA: hypothetical protein ACK8T7_004578 [Klebsiella aerogenes]